MNKDYHVINFVDVILLKTFTVVMPLICALTEANACERGILSRPPLAASLAALGPAGHWHQGGSASRPGVALQRKVVRRHMQGLDLDAAGGVAAPGTWLSRDEEIRRQHAWAEQTDTRLAGVAEQMTIARDNVAQTAGEHLHAVMATPPARRHMCQLVCSSCKTTGSGNSAVKAGKFLKKLHNRIASRVEGDATSSASSYTERAQIGEVHVRWFAWESQYKC